MTDIVKINRFNPVTPILPTKHPQTDGFNEYDKSMLAKDSELPSDEEELAAQLKQAYHDQQALDEKEQIKRLKERFIQV